MHIHWPCYAEYWKYPKSGYLIWLNREPSLRARENTRLEIEIKVAHERIRGVYGALRLHRELNEGGLTIGPGRLKRLRNQLGIRTKQKRRFISTTDSRHNLPIPENVLNQKFEVNRLNQVWLTDLTYVPTDEGWLYLAAIKDLFTCEIVGYAMSDRMTTPLVSQALFRATAAKRPAAGLIHHSDRCSQYCSYEYQALLRQFKMQPSMSRRGNCYDNAPMITGIVGTPGLGICLPLSLHNYFINNNSWHKIYLWRPLLTTYLMPAVV